MASQYPDPEFCIGQPYQSLDAIHFNQILARIIFDMSDKNGDMCVSQDEF